MILLKLIVIQTEYIHLSIRPKYPLVPNIYGLLVLTLTHRLEITTVAPREDSASVIPLPKPVPPPVTNAIFPLKVPGASMGDFIAGNLAPAPLLYLQNSNLGVEKNRKQCLVYIFNLCLNSLSKVSAEWMSIEQERGVSSA